MNTPKPCLLECPVLATEENFDEQQYLLQNPDVAAAVARGKFTSGRAHFRQHGQAEGRLLRIHYNEYVSEVGLSTPLPSLDLIHLVGGHRDFHAFDISRRNAVETIIARLGDAGIDYANFRSILDLGCGCGRILAGWEGVCRPRRASSAATSIQCWLNSAKRKLARRKWYGIYITLRYHTKIVNSISFTPSRCTHILNYLPCCSGRVRFCEYFGLKGSR